MELYVMVFMRGAEFILGFFALLLLVNLDDYLLITPMLFICSILFVTGTFDLLNHRNISHLIFVSLILVIFGLVSYILLSSNNYVTIRDWLTIIGISIMIFGGVMFRVREWNKLKKA